ncbi:MAG TPA: hypothetical protein VI413_04875 [Paludibacter sp.]
MKTLVIYTRYWVLRVFYISIVIFILFGSYYYANPELIIGNYIIHNPLYSNLDNIPAWLYAVDYFIFLFAIGIIIIFCWILYYNTNKRHKEKTDKQYIHLFVSNLFGYLFMVEKFTEKEKKAKLKVLKRALRDDHARRLFINTLRQIHKQTIGPVSEKTLKLMRAVKYDSLVRSYLNSPYLRHKIFALKVISDFNLEGHEKHILRLAKRKNNVLRSEAIVTLLNLKVYEDLKFIDNLKTTLTLWDINIIVKTVLELNIKNIDYKSLIISEYPNVSILGIMLARFNKQYIFKNVILTKIGNSDNLLNEEAFLALTALAESKDDYKFLIDNFDVATEKAQLEIIQTVANSTEEAEAIKFLNWVVENKHYKQKVEALTLLLDLDLESITRFKKSENKQIQKSCLQVLDFNI